MNSLAICPDLFGLRFFIARKSSLRVIARRMTICISHNLSGGAASAEAQAKQEPATAHHNLRGKSVERRSEGACEARKEA